MRLNLTWGMLSSSPWGKVSKQTDYKTNCGRKCHLVDTVITNSVRISLKMLIALSLQYKCTRLTPYFLSWLFGTGNVLCAQK